MTDTNPQQPTILVVEDHATQAALIERLLEVDLGAEIVHVATAEEALNALASRRFDCMWTDLWLPARSGLELVDDARRLRPGMPVGLMTAHADVDVTLMALRVRVEAFLNKPLRRERLLEETEHMLRAGRGAARARTVVAVGAHPDDVEIGCGGALLLHAAAGDRVVIVTLTGGEAGGAPDERGQESADAAAALGAELRAFDLEDTRVEVNARSIGLIEGVLKEVKPDLVYTHSSNDVHQDHRAVHQATLVAARSVPNLFCYQSPSSTIEFRPSSFVEIGAVLEDKLALIARYASQTRKCAYLDPELVRATARYWGRFQGNGFVEPLEVVRSAGAMQRVA